MPKWPPGSVSTKVKRSLESSCCFPAFQIFFQRILLFFFLLDWGCYLLGFWKEQQGDERRSLADEKIGRSGRFLFLGT